MTEEQQSKIEKLEAQLTFLEFVVRAIYDRAEKVETALINIRTEKPVETALVDIRAELNIAKEELAKLQNENERLLRESK